MKKAEFWYQNRHLLNGQVKCDSTQQALLYVDENYPYLAPESIPFMQDSVDVDMDALGGDNFRGFLKMLKKFVRTLSANLPDGVKPVFSKARIDTSYYARVGNKKVHYYPVVIEFDDGQYLVGLARQYGEFADDPHIARDEEIRITKWILNGKDITKAIYRTKEDIASENPSVIAKKIATLVEKNHPQFIKKFPQKQINTKEEIEAKKLELQREIEELKKQIEDLKSKQGKEDKFEVSEEDKQKLIEEVAKTYLTQGEKIEVDWGEGYIQEELEQTAEEMGLNLSGEDIDELAKEVEDYIAEHAEEYGMRFVRSQQYSNTPNYIEPIKDDENTKTERLKENVLDILNSKGIEALNEAVENGKIDYVELVDLLDEDDELRDEIVEKLSDYGYTFDDDLARAEEFIIENCGDEIGYNASASNAKDIENAIDDFIATKVGLEKLASVLGLLIYKQFDCEELKEFLKNKGLIESEDDEEKSDQTETDIETKLKELLKSDDPDYINKELDKITENMSDEEIEKYEDLLNEVNDRAVELASKGV